MTATRMSGDEALARGAIEAGVSVVSSYPGEPVSIPVEVYATIDGTFGQPFVVGDTALGPGLGFNVRFNKAIIWKNQATQSLLYDTRGRTPDSDLKDLRAIAAYSRLVLVF